VPTDARDPGAPLRSGFVTLVGRPNVGKSTLLNRLCGTKVSIVSDKPQTTRTPVRGIVERPGAQIVFVDTPGFHKPVTALGQRLNATAGDALADVDVVCLVVDARAGVGSGDRWVAEQVRATRGAEGLVVVVNKVDAVSRGAVLERLAATADLPADAWFPVSARTGEGVEALVDELVARLPEGPAYFPPGTVSDLDEEVRVAELVREQLLAVTHDELPYSIATRVTELEWPRIRVEILVERESQKGIVIGRGGAVLKQVGTAVRRQLPPGAFVELAVRVDRNWQHRADRVERLGY
jgi:GTP-binding protein Era